MLTWFKRFALVGGIVIVLELVAWVGIATLGPDAFRQLIAFYDPRPAQTAVMEQRDDDGRLQRCAVYRGELLCIGDAAAMDDLDGDGDGEEHNPPRDSVARAETSPVSDSPPPTSRRCATYEGQTICIKEGT